MKHIDSQSVPCKSCGKDVEIPIISERALDFLERWWDVAGRPTACPCGATVEVIAVREHQREQAIDIVVQTTRETAA